MLKNKWLQSYFRFQQKMEHPLKGFIKSLFSDKPLQQVNRWAQYLIEQRFNTVADLRNISNQQWAKMDPNIPSIISSVIQRKVNQKQEVVKQGSFIQRIKHFLSPMTKEKSEKINLLSPSFQTLSDKIKNDTNFMNVKIKIESMMELEQIEKLLQEFFVLSQAKKLAADLFRELKKDTTVLSPIDIFETSLRKLGVPPKDISDIRYLIEKGKKLAVRSKLFELLGLVNGQTQYRAVEKIIIEKRSQPMEGSEFIKEKKCLKLYQYKQKLLQSEKASAKTLIVFGQTGCGKSTFLNAIVNYLAGVEMEDTFRYIVIVENDSNQLRSITTTINDYYIKNSRTGQVYRLIDTPGFGDTEGIQKDNELVVKISDKFKKDIECIHSVLFVMKASTTRVTFYQRYVFQSVMDIFHKQIAPNFVFIFTFSDSGKPQVLESVMDEKYGFGKYWDQITQPKYIEVNNCAFFEQINEQDNIKTGFWNIGIKCLDKLFKKIHLIEPKSLNQSKQMIKTKETLSNQIANTTAIIQQAVSRRQNIKKHIQVIVHHRDEINNNRNFTYQVPQDQWYPEVTSSNVTRCNTSTCFSQKNCHIDCAYGNGEDKINCAAMDSSGYCTICGCHYTSHTNSNIVRKVRQVTKIKINSENKRKYDLSNGQLRTSEAAIKDMLNQLEAEMQKVIVATEEMRILQDKLVTIQMSDRKPESTKAYLQYLIQNENREQSPNYQLRIEGYQEAIKQLQLHEKIMRGQGNNDVKKIVSQLKEANAEKIIDSVQLGLFQKIKKFILN